MQISQARLAKEVLEEIPDQFISYMKAKGIKPRPPMRRQSTVSSTSSVMSATAPPAAGRQEPPPSYDRYASASTASQRGAGGASVF